MRYRFGCTYGYAEGDYRTDVLYLGCGYRFAFGYGLQYFRAAVEICQSGSAFYQADSRVILNIELKLKACRLAADECQRVQACTLIFML